MLLSMHASAPPPRSLQFDVPCTAAEHTQCHTTHHCAQQCTAQLP